VGVEPDGAELASIAAVVPTALLQLPASTSGKRSSATAARTNEARSASSAIVFLIS